MYDSSKNIFILKRRKTGIEPAMMESQPIALTTGLHPPIYYGVDYKLKGRNYEEYLRWFVIFIDLYVSCLKDWEKFCFKAVAISSFLKQIRPKDNISGFSISLLNSSSET